MERDQELWQDEMMAAADLVTPEKELIPVSTFDFLDGYFGGFVSIGFINFDN